MARVTAPEIPDNVVDLFSGKSLTTLRGEQIVRISPEYDGLSMLYSNRHTDPTKLYSMKILCWALRADGEVVGMVPWLNGLIPCPDLDDTATGLWEGYYDSVADNIFFEAPKHKAAELENAADYFDSGPHNPNRVVQEIPDIIGTHAMLAGDEDDTLVLTEVLSWRLFNDGTVEAMLIDEENVEATPVLPGDPCLYAASSDPRFRYFFQHHIANQIKSEDPAALAAIAMLFES
ncbi:MAG: hypothetical protein JWM78_2567 [Verrucomicrobiaceae bacterium]|nr:hypothetical protein [Verrucomicrobiaceae bacterium]